jgi:hypothetical protein
MPTFCEAGARDLAAQHERAARETGGVALEVDEADGLVARGGDPVAQRRRKEVAELDGATTARQEFEGFPAAAVGEGGAGDHRGGSAARIAVVAGAAGLKERS